MNGITEFSAIQTIAVMAVPLILAIVLHEVAHGYVAYLRGDNTAKLMGRLTINPIAHIDIFGTLLLPLIFYLSTGMLFALAKPVPVNFLNLRRPKEDMVLVAAAGPATNLLLAVASAGLLHLTEFFYADTDRYLYFINQKQLPPDFSPLMLPLIGMLYFSVVLNVVLAVINLIPIPPADGGRIVTGLLPDKQAALFARIEPVGLILLMVIVMFNPFGVADKIIWPMIISVVDILI